MKSSSPLGWVGLALSAIYLFAVGFFQWENLKLIDQLSLNEFGDFLAGAFGPLAIFWLVLGFFQQGQELRHSVEALRLQAQELNSSVEQQKRLTEFAGRQLELEENVWRDQLKSNMNVQLPNFVPKFNGLQGSGSLRFEFVNTGAVASAVCLTGQPLEDFEISPDQHELVAPNSVAKFDIEIASEKRAAENRFLLLASSGPFGDRKFQSFLVSHQRLLPRGFSVVSSDEAASENALAYARAMAELGLFFDNEKAS